MSSNLNNTADNLTLGTTVFLDDGKRLEFPPVVNSKYPISISERALREYIARGGEIITIPVADKQLVKKKEENTKE